MRHNKQSKMGIDLVSEPPKNIAITKDCLQTGGHACLGRVDSLYVERTLEYLAVY